MKSLSLLIPCHNEQDTISTFIIDCHGNLSELLNQGIISNFEIIVLDDGSSDNSFERIHAIQLEKVEIESNPKPTGIFNAFEKLYKLARMEWMLLVPGDAQWPAEEIQQLVRFHFIQSALEPTLTKRVDLPGYSKLRIFISKCFSIFSGFILRTRISLDLGSIKILPTFVQKLSFYSRSVLVEIERTSAAIRAFESFRQFPVKTISRNFGKSSALKWKTLSPIFKDVVILVWNYRLKQSLKVKKRGEIE